MEEKRTYPLTRAQEGVVALADMLQTIDSLQLIAYVDFRNRVDEALLIKAIQESVRRLPYCNVRFRRDENGKMLQYMSDAEPAPVTTAEFSEQDAARRDEIFREWNMEFFPGTIENIPLARFRLIHYADGHLGMYFVIQHLIMDGYAGIKTLAYVCRVYMAMLDGKELPKPVDEPWKLVEDDRVFQGSERWKKQRDGFFDRYYQTEPHFTSVNGLGSPEFVEGKPYGKRQQYTQFFGDTIRHSLPQDFVARVNEAARGFNVSPQIFYMTALRSYLGHVSGTDDVSVNGLLASRGTLYEKNCGMNLANSHYVRTIIPESTRFCDAIEQVYKVQGDAMRICKVSNYDVINNVYAKFATPADSFYGTTWLTYFPPVELPQDKIDLDGGFVSQGFIPTPLYLMIHPDSSRGTLCATYWYAQDYVKPESVEALHAFLLRFLDEAVKAPEESIGKLIEAALA